jgi:hypothetical protein
MNTHQSSDDGYTIIGQFYKPVEIKYFLKLSIEGFKLRV